MEHVRMLYDLVPLLAKDRASPRRAGVWLQWGTYVTPRYQVI